MVWPLAGPVRAITHSAKTELSWPESIIKVYSSPSRFIYLLRYVKQPRETDRTEPETRKTEKEGRRMGHGSSKELPGTESTNSEGGSTRFSRMKQKLHVHTKDQHHPHLRRIFRRISVSRGNGSSSSSTSALKLVSVEDFAGIALLTLISADMQFKDRWLACVSLGEQTFRTHISHQLTPSLVFPSLPAFLLFVVLILFFFAFQDPQTCLELGHLLSLSSSSSSNFFFFTNNQIYNWEISNKDWHDILSCRKRSLC